MEGLNQAADQLKYNIGFKYTQDAFFISVAIMELRKSAGNKNEKRHVKHIQKVVHGKIEPVKCGYSGYGMAVYHKKDKNKLDCIPIQISFHFKFPFLKSEDALAALLIERLRTGYNYHVLFKK